jgi:uncharacterized protein (TIGR03437 family)
MSQARAGAACIALPDNRVLVTGGNDDSTTLATAEVYDAHKDAWHSVGSMSVARTGHTATATPWGAVLLVGGDDTGAVEMFLNNETFVTLGTLATPRANFAIASTAGHKVVIAGGSHGDSTLATVEIYDGDTGKIIPGGTMLAARKNFAAVPLLDGSVLLTGGYGADGAILATSEIFDPEHGTSVAGPAMSAARANHQASVLPSNGRVLLVGGLDENGVTASTEIYTPWTGKFGSVAPMHSARQQMAATPLRRGALVVAGGKGPNGVLAGTETFAFATLDTDKADYHPGERATFIGAGWKPGEQVLVQVSAFPLDQHSVEFSAATQADSSGRITITPFNIDRSHAGVRFLATATGSESQAQNVFTDAAEDTTTSIDPIPPTNPFNTALAVSGHVLSSGATNPVNAGNVAVSVDGAPPYSTTPVTPTGTYAATSISSIVPGNHSIVAAYGGGGAPPWNASTSNPPVSYQVTTPTTTTLNSPAAASAQLGTAVLFQATVASTLGAIAPGTGTVDFHDTNSGGAIIVSAPVVAGVAQVTVSNLPVKAYGVQAVFVPAGNSGYSASTSATTTYTVTQLNPITITTTALPANPVVGQQLSLASCVTTVAGIVPTGTITFKNGSAISGAIPLSAGCATFQYSKQTGGISTISVTYSGDTNYRFNGSGAGSLSITVAKAVTASAATSNPVTPVNLGTPVQLIGTVTSTATAANGFLIGGVANATFQDNGVDIPGCLLLTVTSGSASCNLSGLAVGTHPITLQFLNTDPNFLPSTSPVYNLVVMRFATAGALTTIPASPITYNTAAIARVQFGPSGGGPAVTGSVSFYDGASLLGASPVVSGGNTDFVLPSSVIRSVGTHSLTAQYGGDANYSASIAPFPATTLTVSAMVSTISTPTSSAGANYANGSTTTFTAVVSPHPGVPAFTGTVQFLDGASPIGSPIVPNAASGSVTSAALLLSQGSHSITAQFAGDSNYLASVSGPLSLTVGKAASSVSTPVLSSGSATPNSSMTFSSTVTSLSAGVPTGTLTFTVDGAPQPPTAINASGTGSVTVTLASGSHSVSAAYSGDSNFQASASGTLSQSVGSTQPPSGGTDATLTVATNPNAPTIGQSTTFTVFVSSGGPIPTGTVRFFDGTTLLGTAPMANGQAILTTTFNSGGIHNITVNYSGDGSTSALNKTFGVVATRLPVTLSLTSNLSSSFYGQSVTLTAKVASQTPAGVTPPSGPVQLLDGTTLVATGTLTQGTAVMNVTTLDAGSHQITAAYPGDSNWFNATTAGVPQPVAKAQTALAFDVLPDVSGSPQVTVTANVGIAAPGGGIPGGTVQFVDTANNLVLGTAQVVGGTAKATLSEPTASSRTITAIYSGTPNYVDSKSPDVTQISIANAAGFNAFHASPDQIMSIFGANLASGVASATAVPLPLALAGTTVKITDAAGVDHQVGLYFASPTQVNLLIPSDVPLGSVRVTVTNSTGDSFPIVTAATSTAPGLFSANADGHGIAAAQVVRVFPDGTFAIENVAKLDAAQKVFVAAPISFGSEQLFLTLYGTGIRHTPGQNSVTCTINGQSVPILFAGAQPTFTGLDQINVTLPRTLAGTGLATVVVQVDGQTSNSVNVVFQ